MNNSFQTRKIDGDTLRKLAKQLKVKVSKLLALDMKVDPVYASATASKIRNAEWAFSLWKDMGKPTIHGRAFNYFLMGLAHLPHDGRLYDGSDKDYGFCRNALEMARYQGLIPHDKIPDHKTTFHQNFFSFKHEDIHKLVDFSIDYEWIVKKILEHFHEIWHPYQLQDTVCEAWIEKSSIIKTVEPIMDSYKANYIEGEGDISLTRCWEFTQRVIRYYFRLGIKKFRVFYISDFDPVGLSMPISMARKVEYLIYDLLNHFDISFDEIDIRVEDIAVTPEQVAKFGLRPTRIPKEKVTAKNGSKRKTAYATRVEKFHRIYNVKGVVELEALTTTSPDEVPNVLRERLSRYYDKEVDRWITFEIGRVRKLIKKILDNVDWNDLPKLGHLRVDWSPLVEYVEAVSPPEAKHNEFHDWGIFWLLESQLNYIDQLLRYEQFRFNLKDEYFKKRYPEGQRPLPAERVEGESLTDEEFDKFLAYAARKQHELRGEKNEDP